MTKLQKKFEKEIAATVVNLNYRLFRSCQSTLPQYGWEILRVFPTNNDNLERAINQSVLNHLESSDAG